MLSPIVDETGLDESQESLQVILCFKGGDVMTFIIESCSIYIQYAYIYIKKNGLKRKLHSERTKKKKVDKNLHHAFTGGGDTECLKMLNKA